jgi:hypothetical protein
LIKKTYRIAQQIFVGKERAGQKVEGFYILYRYGDFTLYFLSRSFAGMRDIMKNDLTA